MLIYNHAVDNYLDRIKNINPDNATDSQREKAREKIKEVYYNPDKILSIDSKMPPLWIKNDIAVVIANEKKVMGEKKIYKYTPGKGEESIIIPTVYHIKTFTDEFQGRATELDQSKMKKGTS